jgi:prevent-host-death family protein
MKIASVADVKAKLSAYLRGSQEGPVVVTRNGKPVGVLLSVEDEEELERLLLAYSPRLRKILLAARNQIQSTGGISHREFWKEMQKKVSINRKKRIPGVKAA